MLAGEVLALWISMQAESLLEGVFLELPFNILFILALAENFRMFRQSGNKIPRGPLAEVKTPHYHDPQYQEMDRYTPGTEFLEGVWDAD